MQASLIHEYLSSDSVEVFPLILKKSMEYRIGPFIPRGQYHVLTIFGNLKIRVPMHWYCPLLPGGAICKVNRRLSAALT